MVPNLVGPTLDGPQPWEIVPTEATGKNQQYHLATQSVDVNRQGLRRGKMAQATGRCTKPISVHMLIDTIISKTHAHK